MLRSVLLSQKVDFPLYFQILLGQWPGVILEIPYGCFQVSSPFLPDKHRLGVFFFFRFDDGPSKLIPYMWMDDLTVLGVIS